MLHVFLAPWSGWVSWPAGYLVECNLTLLTLGFPYDSFSVQIISDSKERHPTDKNILVSLTKVPPFAPSVPAKYHVKVSWSHSQIFLQVLTCCLPTSWLWPRMSCTADLPILIRWRSLSWGRLLAYWSWFSLLMSILSLECSLSPIHPFSSPLALVEESA